MEFTFYSSYGILLIVPKCKSYPDEITMFLKAYKLSELIFLFISKVANIRCFILIKCSEQEAGFKKICYNVVISENNSNVCC